MITLINLNKLELIDCGVFLGALGGGGRAMGRPWGCAGLWGGLWEVVGAVESCRRLWRARGLGGHYVCEFVSFYTVFLF